MLYALICTDKPGAGLDLRRRNRPDHLAWLDSLGDRLKLAGPFMNESGEEPRGSLVVIEAADMAAAEALASEDPYAKAGVFEAVDIRPWKWLLPPQEG